MTNGKRQQAPQERRRRTGDGVVDTARSVLFHGFEIGLALLVVLLFSLAFLGIISFSFPHGTSLRDLIIHSPTAPRPSTGVETHLLFDEEQPGPILASLVETRRIVKTKDSHGIAWSHAQSGMRLEAQDSVQTFSRSGAVITLGQNNRLDLGENSLIVIRRPERARRGSGVSQASISFEGALEIPASDAVEIATSNGTSVILPEGSDGSWLQLTTNPDKTTTVAVHHGTAEVVSGGQVISVTPNRAVTVDGTTAPGPLRALPPPPGLAHPPQGFSQAYRAIPPQVRFEWDERPGCDAYRLVIGRDEGLTDVMFDRRLDTTEFVHGNLPAGDYYWRVSGYAGWIEGNGSEIRRLQLVRDADPPRLKVEFPDGPIRDEIVLLRGTSEPGAEIFIGRRNIAADESGSFEYALNLQRGVNLVVVEAIDDAGNVAYSSELLHAKY